MRPLWIGARPGTAEPADLDLVARAYVRARASCPDEAARELLRERMIRAASPFAKRLAGRYRWSAELADLEQVAQLGLVKAVDRYLPERGSFTAYALTTIVGELKRHLRDTSWAVHTPRRLQESTLEVVKHGKELSERLGRTPSDGELAGFSRLPVEQVKGARQCAAGYRTLSLNRPVGDTPTEAGELMGTVDPGIERVTDRLTVADLIRRLPEREKRILSMRFQQEFSQADIAEELGVSQMHISRLLTRALTWMREAMLTDTVPPWPSADRHDTYRRVEVVSAGMAGDVLTIRMAGEVDRDNAADFREALLGLVCRQMAGRRVRLDLSRLPFLDAAGIAVLLAVHEAARARAVTVTVDGLPPYLRRVVAATGLAALLPPDGPLPAEDGKVVWAPLARHGHDLG